MKLTFLGGVRTVTGSSYLVEARGLKILVDCGLFQGGKELEERNHRDSPYFPSEIDYIVLTHAHIDHSGLVPKVYRDGFRGRIIATQASADLAKIMLPDSGHIHESEAEWENRKRQRAGKPPIQPLYTIEDALESLGLISGYRYKEEIELGSGVKVRMLDAGHILGSSIVELYVSENGSTKKLVFSGDLGNEGQPIIRDPSTIDGADVLLMETTYGNRTHETEEERGRKLWRIIDETLVAGGNVVIPAFSVGRTQEILYALNRLIENDLLPRVPVFVDSPLATSATEIFKNHPECFDDHANNLLARGDSPFEFPGLHFTRSVEESKAINEVKGGAIIISASGMCESGRIKHHLKHNLWRPESTILFVGYQAQGTLGRRILEGAEVVRIFGEEIAVKAKIESLHGFSAHADRDGLLEWLGSMKSKPGRTYLVHGDEEVSTAFGDTIQTELGLESEVPYMYQTVEL